MKTLKYKILQQHHLEYDPVYNRKLQLLYNGGKDILSNGNLFIPKLHGETKTVYRERLSHASYHNHVAEIVNIYTSDLFSHSLSVVTAPDATDKSTPGELPPLPQFYQEFGKDCDLAEHSYQQTLQQVFTRAVSEGIAYLGEDFPNPGDLDAALLQKEMSEVSIADEKQFNLSRAYVYHIPYCAMINWQFDDFGKLKWCVLHDQTVPQDDPRQQRSLIRECWKIWFFTPAGSVAYEDYQIEYTKDKPPVDEDEIPCVEENTVSWKRIPIKVLFIPKGLDIGAQLYSMAMENFRLRTQINFGESRVANEVPFYGQSNPFQEFNGIPDGPGDDENRGYNSRTDLINKGFLVGDSKDIFEFKGPSGEIYTVLNQQLKDNVNEMHRIHHLMASTIASKGQSNAQSKSGDSKQQDLDEKAKVLQQYATIVKNFAKENYDDIADAREENDIYWQVIGMQDFQEIDQATLLQEVQIISQIVQQIPSKTYQKLKLSQTAMKTITGVSSETMDIIKAEIDKAVDAGELDKMPGGPEDPNAPAKLNQMKLQTFGQANPSKSSKSSSQINSVPAKGKSTSTKDTK